MMLFFYRHMYGRIADAWGRPICSTPGAWIDVKERDGSILWDNFVKQEIAVVS